MNFKVCRPTGKWRSGRVCSGLKGRFSTYYAGKSSSFKHVEMSRISRSADPKVTSSPSRCHNELFACRSSGGSRASFDSSSGIVGCEWMESWAKWLGRAEEGLRIGWGSDPLALGERSGGAGSMVVPVRIHKEGQVSSITRHAVCSQPRSSQFPDHERPEPSG